jgi:hypothetical protein
MLKWSTLRRSWPMTKKQYRTPNVSVGTVKKSIAAMAPRWFLRNVSQRFPGSGFLAFAGAIVTPWVPMPLIRASAVHRECAVLPRWDYRQPCDRSVLESPCRSGGVRQSAEVGRAISSIAGSRPDAKRLPFVPSQGPKASAIPTRAPSRRPKTACAEAIVGDADAWGAAPAVAHGEPDSRARGPYAS